MSSYNWLSAVYEQASFVAFDTETTGIDIEKDRVVEIGAIKFDRSGIISRMNVLINPSMPIPPDASKVNNITDEMLQDKPPMEAVIHDFLRFIKNSILVIHNAKFDIGMMDSELKRLGASGITNKVVDTLVFAREVYPGLKTYALQKLAELFNINVKDAHRAEDDARVCMDFFHLAVQHFFEEDAAMLENHRKETDIAEYITSEDPVFHSAETETPRLF